MVNNENLAIYYEKTKPFCQTYLKEFFSRISPSDLQDVLKSKKITSQQVSPLDEMFLMEACVFLRLSVCNFLAYKDLMCSNYLAWATTTRYYSIFYAVNSLLRLAGKAIVHASYDYDIMSTLFPNDADKSTIRRPAGTRSTRVKKLGNKATKSLQLTRKRNMHSYTVETIRGSEHKRLFDNFSNTFPNLVDQTALEYIISERINWNYDPFFMSQDMYSYALNEAHTYCEHNFIDENFGNYSTQELAEHYDTIRFEYGYEEILTWHLIRHGFEILRTLEKKSHFKNYYKNFWNDLIKSINVVRSKKETKTVIKSFIESLQGQ